MTYYVAYSLVDITNTKENKIERVITLSPLTPMATHFHIRNGAKQININDYTQNFEYEIR